MTDSNGNGSNGKGAIRTMGGYFAAAIAMLLSALALGHQSISSESENRQKGDDTLASLVGGNRDRIQSLEDARYRLAEEKGAADERARQLEEIDRVERSTGTELLGLSGRMEEHSNNNREQVTLELRSSEGRMKDALQAHLDFSDRKSSEIDESIADLRERVRGMEAKMTGMNTQIEVQHRWIRDVIRGTRALFELMAGADWDGERIVWPEIDWTILEGIGEASLNGSNGHK